VERIKSTASFLTHLYNIGVASRLLTQHFLYEIIRRKIKTDELTKYLYVSGITSHLILLLFTPIFLARDSWPEAVDLWELKTWFAY
jgi:hypothetical protein